MGRKATALRTSAKHCHFSRPHLHQQFYLFLLQALRAAFLPVVSDLWGRVWKGKPCCPFLGCGGLEPITKRVPSFCYFLASKVRKKSSVSPKKFHTGETSSSPRKIIARLRSISAQHCCFSHLPMRLSSTQSVLALLLFPTKKDPFRVFFHQPYFTVRFT